MTTFYHGLVDTTTGYLISVGTTPFGEMMGEDMMSQHNYTAVFGVPCPAYPQDAALGKVHVYDFDTQTWSVVHQPSPKDIGIAAAELAHTTFSHRDPEEWPGTEIMGRIVPSAYADGFSAPSGPTRPNPRTISNIVCDTDEIGVPHPEDFTDFFWGWGQFLDHDITLSDAAAPAEPFNIAVPTGDPDFDPTSTGTVELGLNRSAYDPATGTTNPREQLTHITSFVDASNVYGSDATRADWLRTKSGGKLKTSPGNSPPLNDGTINNAVSPLGLAPYVVGDVRGNEQTLLLSIHNVFLREHNFWADQIAAVDASLTDEQIYQKARVMVESIVQNISWNEYLPQLVGPTTLSAYAGYSAGDTSIGNSFANAAYRLGHAQVSDVLWRLDDKNQQLPIGHLLLKDAFFAPHKFANEGGIDPVLRGAAKHVSQALNAKLVPALRNFLFGPPGAGGLDLAALNIQRGRDHGLPDYNTARVALGLGAHATFADISSDSAVATALSTAYGADISLVDMWVGGLAEDHVTGSQLGELFHTIVIDQFTRLRNGDELWFENRMSAELQTYTKTQYLADVIRRNTSIASSQLQNFVMKL